MKILILAALGLLILTMACAMESSAVDIAPQQETSASAPSATPEPTVADGVSEAVSPVVIRDAWRGGMDSREREKAFPPGGHVLLALPQTAFEDVGCHLFIFGGPSCGISYPDPESGKYHYQGASWDAHFVFPDMEMAKAFRESLGRGPVTVSCIIPDDLGVQAMAFQNCEER